jgi:hypothetical protein
MAKFFALIIAFSVICFGLFAGAALAQPAHGFEDEKFADMYPYTNIKQHGQSMIKTGQMMKEMGEKMLKEADENVWKEGGPGQREYLMKMAKMMIEMGEKMIKEGEHMVKEADLNIWKEGGPGGPGMPKMQKK